MRPLLEVMVISGVVCAFAGATSTSAAPRSAQYQEVQQQLARGWNTWDVNSVITHVLLPDGLAIRISVKHRTALASDSYLRDALIERQGNGSEQVFPGPHTWDGSYTELRLAWRGHNFEIQSAHDGADDVFLISPLTPGKDAGTLPPEIVFSVGYLWGSVGNVRKLGEQIEADNSRSKVEVYFVGRESRDVDVPVAEPHFSSELSEPIGLSTGKMRDLIEIRAVIDRERGIYDQLLAKSGESALALNAIETTLGWDTIYEPEEQRVISPVNRAWSVSFGGYVVFEWDTFFAASMAAIGDRNLAYANALETLRGETAQGFVAELCARRRLEEYGPVPTAGGCTDDTGSLPTLS
jgi:putative isomerase